MPDDSMRLHIESLKDLIVTKHDATQKAIDAQGQRLDGAIEAQGHLLESKLGAISDKLEDHVDAYQATKTKQWETIDILKTDMAQAKGAMKMVKVVHACFATAIAALAAWMKMK